MGRRVLHGRVRFVVPASSDSSRNLSRSQLGVYFGSGVGLLNESSTLQERRFSLRSPLLICGRTPLAHETCQRRAIRVWHRQVKTTMCAFFAIVYMHIYIVL